MSNISKVFKKTKPLIAFIMAGDPSLAATERLALEIDRAGADILEIGIPFSDSVADGPVIVEAANRAIKNGVTSAAVIKLVKKLREKTEIPIIFMTSYNILTAYGLKKFVDDSSLAGVNGFIIPDLPLEESTRLAEFTRGKHIDLIFLLAPNSSQNRIKAVSKASTGFIYLMSITGITGVRKSFSGSIRQTISKIRKYSNKPVAIGFGISTPQQAKEAAKIGDGVIVGSAIVKEAAKSIEGAAKLVRSLKKAIS